MFAYNCTCKWAVTTFSWCIFYWTISYVLFDHSVMQTTVMNLSLTDLQGNSTPGKQCNRGLFFLHIAKTGGTTLRNMIARYADRHGCTSVLVRHDPWPVVDWKDYVINWDIFKIKRHFDVIAEHVVWNKDLISELMHVRRMHVTMLREPLAQFMSFFTFLGMHKHFGLPHRGGADIFLQDPARYDVPFTHNGVNISRTRNYQASYFTPNQHNMSASQVASLIKTIERNFELVMISELYDHSLVLLRRLMGWQLADIFYYKCYSHRVYREKNVKRQSKEAEKYRKWSSIDYWIYHHFREKLQQRITAGGEELEQEVTIFRKANAKVKHFCDEINTQLLLYKQGELSKREIRGALKRSLGELPAFHGRDCVVLRLDPNLVRAARREEWEGCSGRDRELCDYQQQDQIIGKVNLNLFSPHSRLGWPLV